MRKYINPDRSEWGALVKRVSVNDDVIAGRVEAILARVMRDGDKAIRELAREIDGVELDAIEVSADEFAEAASVVSQEVKDAISKAAANIAKFHAAQCFKPIEVETAPGVRCVQRSVAIQTVGLYVPGGTAPLFSTVLMLAIPAKVAGCRNIILCTPTNKEGKVAPAVLYAARVCGVHHVYKVGGAQAVGAMAYGTETIPAVDKIFGPGNRYVTKAKESVTDRVSIDMPAGPSEVMVMADETADPRFVASDLLSQAEHGADSQALLVCGSEQMADAVCAEVERQLDKLPRKELTMKALVESRIVILPTVEQQIEFANLYASEHLIISMKEPWKVAEKITAAGSVFIGNYSPESAGDYASGTNHTLPTSGWARSCSGVNIDSFTRKITYQELTAEGMALLGPTIVAMADAEGLDAHANAARLRMGENI
jgi:histidinol dehydrogenase